MMKNKTKLTLCVSACALMAFPAFASGNGNYTNNSQSNWAETRAELNAALADIQGDVSLTAAAISNSFSGEYSGSTVVTNEQLTGFGGKRVNTTSELNVYPYDQLDALESTAAAIANSATISVEDSAKNTWVNNNQYANSNTVAELTASLEGVEGATELTAAALGNSLSVEADLPVGMNNRQLTYGVTEADLTIYAGGQMGDITATAAAIGNSASIEWTESTAHPASLTNRQHLNGNVYSNLELYAPNGVDGSVEATNAAIANSISVQGTGNYFAKNHQTFRGDVAADTTIALEHVSGTVDITTAAIGNSASYEITDAHHVGINNWQRANIDPRATAYVVMDEVDGEINLTTAGIANSLSVSTLPDVAGFTVESRQENNAYTAAITTVDLANVVGDVTLTSAAIGNSVNISNLPN